MPGTTPTPASPVANDAEVHEARDLVARAESVGATPISDLSRGSIVKVAGVVQRVTLRPASDTMRYEVVVYDGTGRVALLFLGRRRVAALEVGRYVVAQGRVTEHLGRTCIYNPVYTLV